MFARVKRTSLLHLFNFVRLARRQQRVNLTLKVFDTFCKSHIGVENNEAPAISDNSDKFQPQTG